MNQTPRFPFLAALLQNDEGGSVVVVRHGQAVRGEVDFERQLSLRGQVQASATRSTLKQKRINPCLVVSSAAPRAIDTVRDSEGHWPEPVASRKLYIPDESSPIAQAINGTFARLGYKPLSDYRAEPGVEQVLGEWAREAGDFVDYEATCEVVMGTNKDVVMIGCHAIMSQELAVAIALDADPNANISVALNVNMGEAEVLVIRRVAGVVTIEHLDASALNHPPA